MNQEFIENLIKNGVRIIDKNSVHFLSNEIEVESEVTIEPFVVINGRVKIASGSVIKSFSYLEDVEIGKDVTIGPFARIRGISKIEDSSKVGNFVEIKNSNISTNSKVSHLSYVGDVEIGENCNIGAGVVFCNYDGVKKHHSSVGNDVFIGSNSTIISPLKIDNNSFIAAGSVINKNVEKEELAIARSRQVNKSGYAKKILKK
jgi:bifunctional UDP-N-acetylglucosamine pyrophosphorylase/glucosamine-1-phosphate N-acetyltransferase